MSKKIFKLLITITVLSFALIGCSSNKQTTDSAIELVLITAQNSVDDKSFNQGAWEGLTKYADENNIPYKYYQSPDPSATSVQSTLELAITGGAKTIVCAGYQFEVPIYNIQDSHPDVTFILLDGQPNDGNGTTKIGENVACFTYAEQQAGFLAGYAAVIDGNRNLGFMGGVAAPAVVRFGYGYIQGAEYAAKELGLNKDEVSITYTYVGNYDASPENQTKAASWFNSGIELIFACGGGVGNSVMAAAETVGTKVIGVDIDQSSESNTVITSAMKNLTKTVYDALTNHYNDSLDTGICKVLDATTDSVLLPMESSIFTSFDQTKYNAIYEELVAGNISILDNTAAATIHELGTELVTVKEMQ